MTGAESGHESGVYGRAARAYWRNGWTCPLPLPPGAKEPPPAGYTGAGARLVEVPTLARWEHRHAAGNIALRLIGSQIGLDVDDYDDKVGGATLAAMEARLGPLPPTWRSTSRVHGGDVVSGIRFYRLPMGTVLTAEAEAAIVREFGPNLEIIRPDHRYAIVWPSVHPDTLAEYVWVGPDGTVLEDVPPAADAAADLPSAWVEFLGSVAGRAGVGGQTLRPAPDLEVSVPEATDLEVAGDDPFDSPFGTSAAVEVAAYSRGEVADIVEAGIRAVEQAPRGRINNVLNREAVHLFHFTAFVSAKELAARLLAAQTKAWVAGGGADDGDTRSARKTITSAHKAATAPGQWIAVPMEEAGGGGARGRAGRGRREETRASTRTGAVGPDGRVRVDVSNQMLAGDWLRERLGTGALSGLFVRDGALVHCPRIGEEGYRPLVESAGAYDGTAQVRRIERPGLKAMIENVYDIGVRKENAPEDGAEEATEEGEEVEKKAIVWSRRLLPVGVAAHAFDSVAEGYATGLPVLQGVTHTPTMRPDGSILDRPGYDRATGLLYLPVRGRDGTDGGEVVVPEHPSSEQVAAAAELVLYPIRDFPFVTEGDRGNWLGTMLAPLLRPVLPADARRLMLMIDAPSPGSGKSLLATMIHIAHDGVLRAGVPTEDKAEMGKLLASILVTTTAPVVIFDNVTGAIRSEVLEGMLTSDVLEERILGASTIVTMVNDRQWIMTGNNAKIGGDLGRRTIWSTIDPRIPDPQNRQFEINPERWMRANRGRYVAALLTLLRAWHLAGRPVVASERSDGFAPLVEAVRGVFEVAAIPLPYGVPRDKDGALSDDDIEWREFLGVIAETIGKGVRFTVSDLLVRVEAGVIPAEVLPGDLAHRLGSRGMAKTMAHWLAYRVGRWAGGLTIARGPRMGAGRSFWVTSNLDDSADGIETAGLTATGDVLATVVPLSGRRAAPSVAVVDPALFEF